MTGHGICNNNHIEKWKSQKEMGSTVNEITAPVDAELKRKIGEKKINELEND